MLSAAVLISSSTSSYVAPVVGPRMQNAVARANAPAMDETILEKALAGELEEEGAENVFMSELGWATYLDEKAGSSYNLNERPSMAQDGYFTADIFSNPADVIGDWLDSLKRYASEPLATAFPTITNDPNELRSYPKGANEVNARTIKPKVKDFDPSKRITGIPGFNFFGSPSSKQEDLF